MTLADQDIVVLRGSYIHDRYTPAAGDVAASGLSYFNRVIERNFIEDDSLQSKANQILSEFSYALSSIYTAELDWQKSLGTSVIPSLTTAQGVNEDLTFTVVHAADDVTIAYVVSGASTGLSVAVTGKDIVVHVATTSGSVADSTALQIKSALDATPAAVALITTALASGSDGSGKPGVMAATHLISDAVRAALALQKNCLFRLIRANVFEDMIAGSGFTEVIPVDARAGEVAEMKDRIMKDRQFVTDKTVQGRRRVAVGG